MSLSSRNKTVPDDIMALQRKRIEASQPDIDKILADFKDGLTWEALARATKEGLVNFIDGFKTLSILIHGLRCTPIPFTTCPDKLCATNHRRLNDGVKLIARLSELEPKEGDHDER